MYISDVYILYKDNVTFYTLDCAQVINNSKLKTSVDLSGYWTTIRRYQSAEMLDVSVHRNWGLLVSCCTPMLSTFNSGEP
jgi:hypothetical protein